MDVAECKESEVWETAPGRHPRVTLNITFFFKNGSIRYAVQGDVKKHDS